MTLTPEARARLEAMARRSQERAEHLSRIPAATQTEENYAEISWRMHEVSDVSAALAEIDALRARVAELEKATLSGRWANVGPDMRWSQVQRLYFIAHLIETKGSFVRADLEVKFGISKPQASVDIGAFKQWNPGVIIYDATAKHFRRALGETP